MLRILFCSLLSLFSVNTHAYETIDLKLDSGLSMSLTQYQGNGRSLLLWLPSERGFGVNYIPTAMNLSALDYDVWAVNLHESYFVPASRESLDEVEIDDLTGLLEHARKMGFRNVYIISSGRSMQLALKMAYQWQQRHPDQNLLRGLISFSPHLISGRTEMGEEASYVEIASYSNLPVYLLQPQFSTKFARSQEIARQLQQGGSQVYVHYLKGVQGGFHMRPNEDLSDRDLSVREQLPYIISSAIQLLGKTSVGTLDKGYQDSTEGNETLKLTIELPGLHPFTGEKVPPLLSLADLKGRPFNLQEMKGRVVLVNFWATWCGPCVEEIPSLARLVERLKGHSFEVVAVNIGESAEEIQKFIRSMPVNFKILLDKDGSAVRDWNVYAYPSNYLIDKTGLIQYSYRGALEWDAAPIIKTIEELL